MLCYPSRQNMLLPHKEICGTSAYSTSKTLDIFLLPLGCMSVVPVMALPMESREGLLE